MSETAIAAFETAIGVCGIAWTERGIAAIQLPEGNTAATLSRLRRGLGRVEPRALSAASRHVVEGIRALLGGEVVDLSTIELDESRVPAFHRRVYAATRAISHGTTSTYGELAARTGDPNSARAVGHALGCNPYAIIVPCHRVLAAGGQIGGFSAGGGAATKRKILAIEGARVGDSPDLFSLEPN